jgi:hypothetical protein
MDVQCHRLSAVPQIFLNEYGAAQSEAIGKATALANGRAGAVENLWLDELHGLRISIKAHDGRWPVSTIKFTERDLGVGCALHSARDSVRSFQSQ